MKDLNNKGPRAGSFDTKYHDTKQTHQEVTADSAGSLFLKVVDF